MDDLDQNEVDKCPKVFDKMSNRDGFQHVMKYYVTVFRKTTLWINYSSVVTFWKPSYRIRRNKRFIKMKELESNGYFELAKGNLILLPKICICLHMSFSKRTWPWIIWGHCRSRQNRTSWNYEIFWCAYEVLDARKRSWYRYEENWSR